MATTAPDPVPSSRNEPLSRPRAEVERLCGEATRQKDLAHRRAEFWVKTDIALGFPAALLAGVSGAAGLASADARVPAALVALAAAGCAAGAGFLRSDSRRLANKRARQAWAFVEARARMKLAQDRVLPEDLAEVLDSRQAALAAYEGEDPPPGPTPTATPG
ncbi:MULTISPECIES: hypothetical protein [unclassified Streptomyces]|uniref:hypothetical protein n=1 Tax=unclassified Streptomyces TaxID=2593676 RepID=UPI00087E5047|nr:MULTISPECIES: hypothetical protein [unclassified Streptomyces]PBC80621.1 hypothetical protein BX261_0460 [Streptomyces sp. 2321.6]SDR57887.1 hypothetical protein SAMN05216511_6760 [Streptomyces sp. KS_16]SEB81942.1 hypothetical protein SAMN05428940_0460 [Streptomyces sp. 2133.1]SEF13740.1 hypothetical protein SAMN05428954_6813 [Streptomyces sp. 2112.3]SNC61336.1 hypothetical protein SAMN06272741_0461 [Streptomyces sp. 2114.4]